MFIKHHRLIECAWPLLVFAALLLAISACSDDSSSSNAPASLPYTNDDGVAELTAVPTLPASLSTTDTTVETSFDVDSDTARIAVYLHPVGDNDTTPAAALDQDVTAGATNSITLTVYSSVTAGTEYYVEMITCAADTALCDTSTNSSNDSGYADVGDGNYTKFDMAQTDNVNTGVKPPAVTAE